MPCLANDRQQQGFTLLEVLVVVFIVGVIAMSSVSVNDAGRSLAFNRKIASGILGPDLARA